ncbi:MAG: redoxin family protein [Aquaticitalea sp.]
MKHIFLLLIVISLVSCKNEPEPPKDYVTLSGKIENQNSDTIVVRSRTYSKTLKVNADGTFKDTLKVAPGVYNLFDGSESTTFFLKNGYDLNITINTEEFDETVTYSGEGSEHSNYLAKHSLLQEELFDNLNDLDETTIDSTFDGIHGKLTEFYATGKDIDTMITNGMTRDLEPMLNYYKGYFAQKIAFKKEFPKGTASPVFNSYENYKGGTTSLSDLKGKYVYIDVWATWCGPCIAEIPSLKKIEHDYEGKKIEFVSISVDDARRSGGGSLEVAKEKWRAMIAEEDLGGIQLFSDDNWNSEFIRTYKINSIPRFLLIDPNGNIVDADAPRPSSEELIALFNELKI